MQFKIDEKHWAYQTVVFRGQRFCLTHLGFGLDVATIIMKAVLDKVRKTKRAGKEDHPTLMILL